MNFDFVALSGALGALKALTGIAKDVNNVEFNQQLIELQQKLLDVQSDYGKLMDENRALRVEIEEGKAYDFHHSVYWKKLPDGSEMGPLCPICYGEKQKVMPLKSHGKHASQPNVMLFSCPILHVPQGRGLEARYQIPADLIPAERYSAQI